MGNAELMVNYFAALDKEWLILEECGSIRAIFLNGQEDVEVGYTYVDRNGIQQYGLRKDFIDFLSSLEFTEKEKKDAASYLENFKYNVEQVG